ncbi:MAG: HPP family protein [Candidatus Accumulibacter sp.]|jgi:CBS-domain-containing membrane protein|nr:HPP family protein [Accumulibacter sp.]
MYRHPIARLLWCILGIAAGIALALAVSEPPVSALLLASLGGSAVFLFAFTRMPAAQPRALLGGHLNGALIGIACYQFFGDALWVYVLAQSLTLALMLLTRTVHPPAGANPILMIHAQADWAALFQPVLTGAGALVLVVFLWSRLYPGLVHYPIDPWAPSPARIDWGGWED